MSPRPVQATGRPATPVIPTAWDVAHAAVAAGALRGLVDLTDPAATGDPVWVNDQWTAGPAVPYTTDVPARVQRLNAQNRNVVAADDDEVIVDHLVQVPHGHTAAAGHLVAVTAAPDDSLVGLVLRVEYVAVGTERFTRDLFCTLT